MLSNQEAFTKVVRHLRKQGKKAIQDDICQYRTPDGCSCVIGCLIPDDKYRVRMEGRGAEMLLFDFPRLQEYLPEVTFAQVLQRIHDKLSLTDWEEVFRNVAARYSLTWSLYDHATYVECSFTGQSRQLRGQNRDICPVHG